MTNKIRVLYTIPNFDTAGSGKSVYDLVKHIDRERFEPEICCSRSDGPFFDEVKKLDVKIHIFPFKANYRPWLTFPFRVLKIRKFFKQHNFDIIHSWNWSSDFSEPLAARIAGIPYLYTKKAMGWGSRFWVWKSKLSSKIIAVNQDIIDLYLHEMKHKVVRFPLAIDTQVYKPNAITSEISKSTFFGKEDFVILSIANLVEVKGIEILIQAVEVLEDKHIKVLIVGNDTNDYGTRLKKEYEKNPNIVFAGKQLEVRPYLQMADLFVIPTKDEGRREGIPNAPLEAMATECVVLGSRVSGVKDVLNAFPDCIFEASNINELAEKIQMIKTMSSEERSRLGKAMRAEVIREFSIEEFLKRHETVYESVLS